MLIFKYRQCHSYWVRVRWLGHSAFELKSGDTVLVDPFLTNNPKAPLGPDALEPDIICVTHGHSDHLGDSIQIAKRTHAPIIAIHEIALLAAQKGAPAEGMNIGGTIRVRDTDITMTPATHSSSIENDSGLLPAGDPGGFIISSNSKTVYHAGDTGLFFDMRLIGERGIDVALLPIGDRYTMGAIDAAKATELLRPKLAIPMHYNTFPGIEQDPQLFKEEAACEVTILKPGEEVEI